MDTIDFIREQCRRYLQNAFNLPFLWRPPVNCLCNELKLGVCVTLDEGEDYDRVDELRSDGYNIIIIPANCSEPLEYLKETITSQYGKYFAGVRQSKIGSLRQQVAEAAELSPCDFDDEAYYNNWAKNRLHPIMHNVFQRIKFICDKYKVELTQNAIETAAACSAKLAVIPNGTTRSVNPQDKDAQRLSNGTVRSTNPQEQSCALPISFVKAITEFYYLSDHYEINAPLHLEFYNVKGDILFIMWTNESCDLVGKLNIRNTYYMPFSSITEAVDHMKYHGIAKVRCVETNYISNDIDKMILWLAESCIYDLHNIPVIP